MFAQVKRKNGVMNANAWQRLSELVYARMDYLGLTQTALEQAGGPSSAWVRKLKAGTGRPSARMARSLRELSVALGWEPNTAWSVLTDDRDGWSAEVLADEDRELIQGEAPTVHAKPAPASLVRRVTDLLRSDAMGDLSETEWEELLAAVEARQPKRAKTRGRKVSGQ